MQRMQTVQSTESRFSLRPLSPALGAELVGFDFSAAASPQDAAALRQALARHGLLLVRGRRISTEEQTRFGALFGDVTLREKNKVRNAEVGAQHVSNVRADGLFGKGELDFHVDQLFHKEPLRALILYAIELPSSGGATRFSNAERALDAMPAALRARIETLSCRHAYTFAGDLAADWNVDDAKVQPLSAVHPMVWTDPQSGRRSLWVNKITTVEVVGLGAEESRALMQEVRGYLYGDDIVYTHEWRIDDLLIWDNRMLHHARTPFDESQPRTLRRTPIL